MANEQVRGACKSDEVRRDDKPEETVGGARSMHRLDWENPRVARRPPKPGVGSGILRRFGIFPLDVFQVETCPLLTPKFNR